MSFDLDQYMAENADSTVWNLSENEIGEKGGKAIGQGLETNSTLTTLTLLCNGIGVKGGTAIGKALETNSTLTTLNLSSNGIGDDGGKAIGRGLETNSTLTTLDLGDNGIGAAADDLTALGLGTVEDVRGLSTLDDLEVELKDVDSRVSQRHFKKLWKAVHNPSTKAVTGDVPTARPSSDTTSAASTTTPASGQPAAPMTVLPSAPPPSASPGENVTKDSPDVDIVLPFSLLQLGRDPPVALGPVAVPPGEPAAAVFPYDVLRTDSGDATPDGVDTTRREDYLSPADFQAVFKMSPSQFASLPVWKRKNLKKDVHLF